MVARRRITAPTPPEADENHRLRRGLGNCACAADHEIVESGIAIAAALVLIGVVALTFTNPTNDMMQLSTEPEMRGRVMALRIGVALGGTPIGAPIVGWVADHFGPRWALGVGAMSGFAAALVAAGFLARQSGRAEGDGGPSNRNSDFA